MIYALRTSRFPLPARMEIARAIQANDSQTIQRYVEQKAIVHILDVLYGPDLYCLFCRIPVFPTTQRYPQGHTASGPWYFEHKNMGDRPSECVGYVRGSNYAYSLGIVNPDYHGCYVAMGCEVDNAGRPTEWHRTRCRVLDVGRTYCHHAAERGCLAPSGSSDQ
jgi:hypothetical protein